jgi:hypothetical protein
MSLLDDLEWGFGFSFGYTATEEAINAVSNRYRAKDFDPVVRKDLLDIMKNGRLANIAYPFPKQAKPQKKPIFFVRHKIFSISLVLCFFIVGILAPREEIFDVTEKIVMAFAVFWFFCIMVMLVKKVLRGGKKASDLLFQTEYINQGNRYWNVREYVRQALEIGELDAQGAYIRIRNTDLGRQLPDTDTEIEARVFNSRKNS